MRQKNCLKNVVVPTTGKAIEGFDNSRSLWYETAEEIEAGLAWGREKAALLRWLRRHMDRGLSLRERRCVELYFLKGMNYRTVGVATGTNASSVHRAIVRALRKLRRAAAEHPPRGRRIPRDPETRG